MKKHFFAPICVLLLTAVFGLGFLVGQNARPSIEKISGVANKELGQPAEVDFSLFWDAWYVIETEFVDRASLDRQQMIYGSISGLLESLDDPHSVFMEPKNTEKFLDDISGSFSGIGAEVDIRGGLLTIVSPLADSPAQAAGLQPGDKILEVDGASTAELTLNESVNLIRGELGTAVRLLTWREAWEEAREIEIVRDTIKIPILKWEIKDDNVAYIQIYHFTENLPVEFRRIVDQVKDLGLRGMVLDVRNNPGGYMEVAVDIASWFLPKGELVVIEDFGEGERPNEFRSRGYEEFENLPIVILVNEGSASASEILAGALRDIRGVTVVGAQTFGKGSVQQLEKLKGGSSVKITIAKWLTPSGCSINDEGITPDVEVEMTMEDIDQMLDPQLNKALELFNE